MSVSDNTADAYRSSFRGATAQEAEISSVIMVGARKSSKDENGRGPLESIDRSILSRFLLNLSRFDIPVGARLSKFKDSSFNQPMPGVVKSVDINPEHGGVDLYDLHRGVNPAHALILCGIPVNPQDYQQVNDNALLSGLFSYNHDYQHSEDDYYNLRMKIHELSPKVLFCAGGDDCLSWREVLGPDFVAVYGDALEGGVIFSKEYLGEVSAYLMMQDSPLFEVAMSDAHVFKAERNGVHSMKLASRDEYSSTPLWPVTMSAL